MAKKEKIIITGGNGFIGSHIVDAFCRQDFHISCLVRPEADLSALQGLPVQIIRGDITDGPSLAKLFTGHDAVIHNAALVRDWGAWADFQRVNAQGTENVLRACVANGIRGIIMTGSISVYGEEHSTTVKDESSPWQPHYHYFLDKIFPSAMNYYRDSKATAVRRARRLAERHQLNITILEPVWVYGEREFHSGFYEYVKAAQAGLPLAPGSQHNKFHVIYAGDLAEAYVRAFRKKLPGIQQLIIGNPRAERMDEIMTLFCREAGVRKPRNAPKWLLQPIGFLLELLWTLAGASHPPLLTRARVNMFYDNIEYSTDKARRLLGDYCRHDLQSGIRRTVQWYRDNNYL